MRLSVFGLGYVGAVSAGCLTDLRHQVIGVDIDRQKISAMMSGKPLIEEPGLTPRIQHAIDERLFTATTSTRDAIRESEAALICVGTPSQRSGGLDDVYLRRVMTAIATELKSPELDGSRFDVIVRSTCLPKTHQSLQQILVETSDRELHNEVGYIVHPEFLREGSAVSDFFDPPKIVFGCVGDRSRATCEGLYPDFAAPTFFVHPMVAAMVKYADNCFHAAKVTFANEMGTLCRSQNVDAMEVMRIFREDTKLNISPKYLRPGSAFGGSCLPKDLRAMLDLGREEALDTPMLRGVLASNQQQIEEVVQRVTDVGSESVGILGLAFKQGTDDVRESPAVAIAERLLGKGKKLRIYDGHLSVEKMIGANRAFALQSIPHLESLLCATVEELFATCGCILIFHTIANEQLSHLTGLADQIVIDMTNTIDWPGIHGLHRS